MRARWSAPGHGASDAVLLDTAHPDTARPASSGRLDVLGSSQYDAGDVAYRPTCLGDGIERPDVVEVLAHHETVADSGLGKPLVELDAVGVEDLPCADIDGDVVQGGDVSVDGREADPDGSSPSAQRSPAWASPQGASMGSTSK